MKRYTVTLTIGHNVKGVKMFTTREVSEYAAEYLKLGAFTAFECVGMWNGEAETSTRLEVAHADEDEAARIRSLVPLLAQVLAQDSIMCETRPDLVQFVDALTVEAVTQA